MSVERRLREGLVRNAEAFDPQVERRLATLASRHRRRRRLHWAAAVVAAAAALATGALVAPGLLGERSHTEQVEVGLPTVSASPGQLLTGSYRTTVPAATGVVTSASLAGRWALTLRADGTMTIRAPAAYTGVLSGAILVHLNGVPQQRVRPGSLLRAWGRQLSLDPVRLCPEVRRFRRHLRGPSRGLHLDRAGANFLRPLSTGEDVRVC
jgi:hypothetical protein